MEQHDDTRGGRRRLCARCGDDRGQYVIPFPVVFRDDSWWNAHTGEERDTFIAGWRPAGNVEWTIGSARLKRLAHYSAFHLIFRSRTPAPPPFSAMKSTPPRRLPRKIDPRNGPAELTRLHQLRGLGDAKLLKSLGRSFKGRHYRG